MSIITTIQVNKTINKAKLYDDFRVLDPLIDIQLINNTMKVTGVAQSDDIQAVYDAHDHTVLTDGQRLDNSKTTVRTLAAKAKNHADKIALCFTAVVSAEEAGDSDAEMFTRVTDALNDPIVSNGFRTLVMTAFTAQTGLSIDLASLGAVVIGTKQSFNQFAAGFFTRWVFMVSLA